VGWQRHDCIGQLTCFFMEQIEKDSRSLVNEGEEAFTWLDGAGKCAGTIHGLTHSLTVKIKRVVDLMICALLRQHLGLGAGSNRVCALASQSKAFALSAMPNIMA
jgi:hypothetical protein